jgi:hypothetical protein
MFGRAGSAPRRRGVRAGPGGNGTGNAVVAAYVLAGELAAAGGHHHQTAFGRYQRLLRPYVAKRQQQARGGKDFLAPLTPKKIAQVQRFYKMLPYLPVMHLTKHLTTRTAAGIKLPYYPAGTTLVSGKVAQRPAQGRAKRRGRPA